MMPARLTSFQLDSRYFHGFEGEYTFLLHFILQKKDSDPGDYVCRVRPKTEDFFRDNRSVSCEVDLEPGVYEVLPKITARKSGKPAVENIVTLLADEKPQKLRQVGLSFDLAHAKALKSDLAREQEAEERKKKKTEEKKKAEEAKAKAEEVKAKAKEDKAKKAAEKAAKRNDKKNPGKDETKVKKTEEDKPKEEEAKGGEEKGKAAEEGERVKAKEEEGEEESDEDDESGGEGEGTVAKADVKPKKESASTDDHDSDWEDSDDSQTEGHPDADEGGSTAEEAEEGEVSGETAGGPDDDYEPEDGSGASWNAVCVIGLRVYSQHSSLTITLADPKNAEEAASVVVNP